MSAQPPAIHGWDLRRRLSATFAVLAVLVLAGTVAAGITLNRLNSAQHRQVDSLDPAIQTATDLFISYVNQETGLRGYAIAHQPLFLQPYNQGRADSAVELPRLRRQVAGDPRLEADVDNLAKRAAIWQSTYVDRALSVIKATPDNTIPPVELAAGKQLFDNIRAADDQLNANFAAARQKARQQLSSATVWLVVLIILATVLTVLVAVALWIALRRWITQPLSALSGEVRIVAAGDLEHEVTATGPPDIVALGNDAELMRERMLSEYRAATAARAEAQAAAVHIAEQAEELRRSNSELEQFAYIASHDLQEPLRKVASFCQMLERRYAGQLDERADLYIAFAVDGAKRMQNLINDLLAFSRVGRNTSSFRPTNLNDCVAEAISDLDTLLTHDQGRVEVSPLPVVPGDRSLLRQLFVNLIANGVKFRRDEPPVVSITAERTGEFWSFTVSDNGIGIDPRYAERVFAIFSRLHPREKYQGTGIGLALCRKIVEYHGGKIKVVPAGVDGAPQTGATLRFTLPITSAVTMAGPAPTQTLPASTPTAAGFASLESRDL